jgi:hypothetical protein
MINKLLSQKYQNFSSPHFSPHPLPPLLTTPRQDRQVAAVELG